MALLLEEVCKLSFDKQVVRQALSSWYQDLKTSTFEVRQNYVCTPALPLTQMYGLRHIIKVICNLVSHMAK